MGYDRFEGRKAWEALASLYRVLRQYVNFFQPSMKLLSKERCGGKVSKTYDRAKTPYQRVLLAEHIGPQQKERLAQEYDSLDPVRLLAQLEKLQDKLWQYSWNKHGKIRAEEQEAFNGENKAHEIVSSELANNARSDRYYRHCKRIDRRTLPRNWRTRKDPFENAWDEVRLRLELKPELTAKDIIDWLMGKYPGQHPHGQIRTLQRRIAQWRLESQNQEEKLRELLNVVKPLSIDQLPISVTNDAKKSIKSNNRILEKC